jgi:argininosuccinate lyase
MSKKLWGGRYASQTHADVEQYTASIDFDVELAFEDLLGSMAHAEMLTHCRILTAEENTAIQAGLKSIAEEIAQNKIQFTITDEDIHMNIERTLTEKIGPIAGKLHTARSRNDQVSLDLHLYLRQQIVFIVDLLNRLQETLLALAKKHSDIILPGYTHLQRAQPIYLAVHWLAYVAMFQRDSERLQALFTRVNKSPLGAAALTATSFGTDRAYTAKLLGFDGIYFNTLDAVSDRDFAVEFLAASSLIMMHISRMSEELVLWSSQEFNFVSFDEGYCTGSSIMPQKKNPDVVELGRGKTGRVYGALFSLLTILKGLPLAYNKDLQEDKEPLFDTVKTLTQTLAIYSPMLSTLKINSDVMRQAASEGYLNATILAEYLVKKGMPFREAHGVVGRMVALCIERKCNLEDFSLSDMQAASATIQEDIYEVISIEKAVAACIPAKNLATEMASHTAALVPSQTWVKTQTERFDAVRAHFGLV